MTEKQFREKERVTAAKKKSRKVKRKKKAGAVAVLLILLSLLLVAVLSVVAFTLFKIESITVTGNSCYTAEQIIRESDIEIGDSLLFLSEDKLSERLSFELPYISKIKLRRQLPNTLQIEVTEAYEELCFYRDGIFYSADGSKKLLNEYSERPSSLPVIISSESDTLNLGEKYLCENAQKQSLENAILKFAKDRGINVTLVNATDIYRTNFVIEDKIAVELGSATYLERKLEFIPKTVENMVNGEQNIIDISNWTPDNNEAVTYENDINKYLLFN